MKKRHGAAQIVALLRQAEVALGKGEKVPEVCVLLGSQGSQTFALGSRLPGRPNSK